MPPNNGDLSAAAIRARWAEVVERATPVIKPLLGECRPIALDGVRLTLAFPEGRDFMRSRITQRAPAIEQLLSSVFGGSFAVECVATNVELEPLSVAEAIGDQDPDARALLEGVLKITGREAGATHPEVRLKLDDLEIPHIGERSVNIGQIAKMAQQMQTQMAQAQAELKERTLEATAGGGAVRVVITGAQEIRAIEIDPGAIDPTRPRCSRTSS